MNPQLITLENQTSENLLSPDELFNIAWALNYQAVYHYGRSPWVEHGYAPPAHVQLLPPGATPPQGAWNLILLGKTDEAGTLGFHADQEGSKIPYGEVFVETADEEGVKPSEVASHEMLELLVDPNVEEPRKELNAAGKEWVIVEVGDPVQGNGYDVGAPEGRETGVIVADFAWPAWWKMGQTRPDMSFRDSVKAPYELAPKGYISVAPENEAEAWTQIYGAERSQTPAWDEKKR